MHTLTEQVDNIRIKRIKPLISPALLIDQLPLTPIAAQTIAKARLDADRILQGNDDRLLVITGPCSIHDVDAAIAYAKHLKAWQQAYQHELCIIMRVYFEKPRTTIGWKGLINDPHLDNSFDINHGLQTARSLLLNLANEGIPTATEFLDTIIPQYIADLISWGAIGARTSESQIHRELASGLSMPIGFKNGTHGDVGIAIDGINAAKHSHHFLSVTKQGISAIVTTTGNESCHIILRGAKTTTNYQARKVDEIHQQLTQATIQTKMMIDCSHGNSNKDHAQQPLVAQAIADQVAKGKHAIGGVMLESHLVPGKQAMKTKDDLQFGQSITDACIGLEQTQAILAQLADAVKAKRKIASSMEAA